MLRPEESQTKIAYHHVMVLSLIVYNRDGYVRVGRHTMPARNGHTPSNDATATTPSIAADLDGSDDERSRIDDIETALHVTEVYVEDLESEVARLRATSETLQALLDAKDERIEQLQAETERLAQ